MTQKTFKGRCPCCLEKVTHVKEEFVSYNSWWGYHTGCGNCGQIIPRLEKQSLIRGVFGTATNLFQSYFK